MYFFALRVCNGVLQQCSANGTEAYTKKSATMRPVGTDDTLRIRMRLLGCLGLSTLELTKELIRHSRVKSRMPGLRCSASGGPTTKVHWHIIIIFSMQLYPFNCSASLLHFGQGLCVAHVV